MICPCRSRINWRVRALEYPAGGLPERRTVVGAVRKPVLRSAELHYGRAKQLGDAQSLLLPVPVMDASIRRSRSFMSES